ncbi:MAG TPA: hypothetical protein VKB93_18875 [Thermoanaerobaculia bacterium]|nr:hypothetical protein [Thermoanaerobaculia bacterium]
MANESNPPEDSTQTDSTQTDSTQTDTPQTDTPQTGDAASTLLAVSTTATPADTKKAIIFNCVAVIFNEQGLPTMDEGNERIVWSSIEENVVIAIGNGVTDCITGKGYECPALATVFCTLREMNQVTVVSDLVNGIEKLVTP